MTEENNQNNNEKKEFSDNIENIPKPIPYNRFKQVVFQKTDLIAEVKKLKIIIENLTTENLRLRQKSGIMQTKLLLVVADFYEHIAEMLLQGAISACEKAGAEYEVVKVAGALEIPPAIAIISQRNIYDGYVALGCVIRGETSHYDTVCNESARGLMELGIKQHLAIGNGILTVENEQQALVRADIAQKNKGGGAVEACLGLINLLAVKTTYT